MQLSIMLLIISQNIAVNTVNTESDPAISEPIAVTELAKTQLSTLAANHSPSPSNHSSLPLPPLSDLDLDLGPIEHSLP